jgi:hypothetical protein
MEGAFCPHPQCIRERICSNSRKSSFTSVNGWGRHDEGTRPRDCRALHGLGRGVEARCQPVLMRFPEARDRRKPPGLINVCQPVAVTTVPTGSRHELHLKVRIRDAKRVHLWSSNGRDRTAELGGIIAAVMAQHFSRIVLDGARDVGRRGRPGDVPLRLPPRP